MSTTKKQKKREQIAKTMASMFGDECTGAKELRKVNRIVENRKRAQHRRKQP